MAILLSHAQVLDFPLDKQNRLSFGNCMLCYLPRADVTRISFWNSFQFANTHLEVEYWAGRSVL